AHAGAGAPTGIESARPVEAEQGRTVAGPCVMHGPFSLPEPREPMAQRKLGILTGGGDCPGLNAVLRAVAHRCAQRGVEVLGYLNGWQGVLEGRAILLDRAAVKGILPLGGTILGTSRTDPLQVPDGVERLQRTMEQDGLEGMIVVGGDGTLSAATELLRLGFPVVGVPKTIDNDLSATDFTFGFDTAVTIATDAIDRLHT